MTRHRENLARSASRIVGGMVGTLGSDRDHWNDSWKTGKYFGGERGTQIVKAVTKTDPRGQFYESA
jgi:hypothetical protein